METRKGMGILILFLVAGYPLVEAATTAKTTFSFNVPVNRSITVAYGGSCGTDAFFFNEVDANYDPDTDGNASRVKPSAQRMGITLFSNDENFVGITNPSITNSAYEGALTGKPSTNDTPSTEVSNSEYTAVSIIDGSGTEIGGIANTPSQRFVFNLGNSNKVLKDFNFFYYGQAQNGATCIGGTGADRDLNLFAWNYTTEEYDRLATHEGTGVTTGVYVPIPLTIFVDYNTSAYIDATGTMTFLAQGRAASTFRCLYADYVKLTTTAYHRTETFCQSETVAPITITNNGNTAVNIDGNFSTAFSGADVNIALKAWMGTGAGCGTDGNGLGGWEGTCSVSGATTAVSATQCKEWNTSNATTASRLTTQLGAGDTNALCFSGEFIGFVGAGDHNQTYQTGAGFS
jgi:hypothetical protein